MTTPVPPDETPAPPDETPPVEPVRVVGWRDGRAGTALVAVTLALVAALWATTAVGRVVRAPPAGLTVAVTLLPYLYVGAGAWCFAVWCVLPDRRVLPASLAAVVLSAAALWAPGWPARTETAGGEPVRVMTWNVRRLWGGPESGDDPLRCVVEGIREAQPDLVTLLEVSRRDVDRLSAALDLDCVHTDYRGSGSEDAGGLASCARGDWEVLAGSPQRFTDADDWHYVFTEMGHDGHVLNLIAVHLHPYWPAISQDDVQSGVRGLAQGETEPLRDVGRTGSQVVRAQGDQSVALLARVGRFHDPSVVSGDFNSTRDVALHAQLRQVLTDAWERGGRGFGATVRLGGWLPLRIDYVYVSEAFAVAGADVPAIDCSDHRPVVADLVLRDGA